MASTSPSRRAYSSSGATGVSSSLIGSRSSVPFVHDPQTVERQPGLLVLDGGRERGDEGGQPAGGHHGAFAQLVDEAPHEVVDLAGEAVDGARLDRLHRRLADDVAGRDELDLAQPGGPAEEGVHRHLDAGDDGAAEVLTLGADGVEGGGRAEVDHDARAAVEVVGG